MNHHDVKFILRARRPGDRDAQDPQFAEALAEVAKDPQLQAWHEREQRADAALAAKFAAIAPPPGLREAILAGARASRPRPAGWRHTPWLAAAAAVAVLLAVAAGWRGRTELPAGDSFAAIALRELASAHGDHDAAPPALGALQTRLAAATGPLPDRIDFGPAELRRQGCRSFRVGGREVFELCFLRAGTWYHLYVSPAAGPDEGVRLESAGQLAAATWRRGAVAYALATDDGRAALQRLL